MAIGLPPIKFKVISPSSRPEQDTLVTSPFEYISFGSVISNVVSLVQFFASVTEMVYVPPSIGSSRVAFPPGSTKLGSEEDHVQARGALPPETDRFILPSSSPLQRISVTEIGLTLIESS